VAFSDVGLEFPRVAHRLAQLPSGEVEAAARRVVEGALARNGVAVASTDLPAVERLVWSLDDAAWKLQEETDQGKASATAYNEAFRRARAANGLLELLQGRYGRAMYEATHALYGNEDATLELIGGEPPDL
jgi:hypothetical protein